MEKRMPRVNLSKPAAPVTDIEKKFNINKWIPLLCAGAAVGVTIIALNELKKVRKELFLIKKESGPNEETTLRMGNLEKQLKILSEFVKEKPPQPTVLKNVVKEDPPVRIINEEEYEEIEVTDDEEEEN